MKGYYDNNLITPLYPGAEDMVFKPMLIKKGELSEIEKAAASGLYYAQEKIDGYLEMLVKGSDGQIYMFSRAASRKTGLPTEKIDSVPFLKDVLKDFPNRTILLGEIYMPNGTSRDVTTILGCLSEKAIERQKENKLNYYIYDILMYDGIDFIKAKTSNIVRYNILNKLWEKYNLNQYDFIQLAKNYTENIPEILADILNSGGEGMVLKLKDGIYEVDKRPTSNLKAKQVDYLDCFITGFEKPEQYYSGKDLKNWEYWMNSDGTLFKGDGNVLNLTPITKYWFNNWMNSDIKLGMYDEQGNVVDLGVVHSGISDEMRADMSTNPDKYLGKVVEIQCMSIDKNEHTLRHGFLHSIREDKSKEDCIWKN